MSTSPCYCHQKQLDPVIILWFGSGNSKAFTDKQLYPHATVVAKMKLEAMGWNDSNGWGWKHLMTEVCLALAMVIYYKIMVLV